MAGRWVLPGCVSRPPRPEHPQKQTDILSGWFWVAIAARSLHRISNFDHSHTEGTPVVYRGGNRDDSGCPSTRALTEPCRLRCFMTIFASRFNQRDGGLDACQSIEQVRIAPVEIFNGCLDFRER